MTKIPEGDATTMSLYQDQESTKRRVFYCTFPDKYISATRSVIGPGSASA
jgi:hypothetical protein